MSENIGNTIGEGIPVRSVDDFERAPIDREIAFYNSICLGNIELVHTFRAPLACEGCGTLSENPIRNLKYHFVISAAMIARYCINSGMPPEEAYSLSDMYIRKADKCKAEAEVRKVHDEMIDCYTRNMRRVRNSGVYSKQILRAIDYISEHLHSRILIKEASEHLKISPAYLSRLFKAETGISFSDYVCKAKVEEAANLLQFSEYTDLEISNLFCFSSQSHFIRVFKKYMGVTPKEYKKQCKVHGIDKNEK